MNQEQILQTLKKILQDSDLPLKEKIDAIDYDTSLVNDLALDSIQILSLIISMEKEFNFICQPNELDLSIFERFGNLISFVEGKVNVVNDRQVV